MLDPHACRARQRRLLEVMQQRRLDAVALGAPHHVYYFTSHLADWKHQAGCIIFADGRCWLCSANEPASSDAVDEAVAYEANTFSTLQLDQAHRVAAAMRQRLGAGSRIGVDASDVIAALRLEIDQTESIEPALWQMRRIKDADELELMKRAIVCCQAMYARARQIIEPGIPELRVFTELYAAAVEAAGEMLTAPLGNDFACGEKGGPPRAGHVAKAGQIYILDVGPAVGGYFADNARSFSVDRKPTDAQIQAWQILMQCHDIITPLCKPGARCQDLFDAVNHHLRDHAGAALEHHLGHGVGLNPHEYPYLNPHFDDVLQEGEVISIEPGLYGEHLGGGIRIENQYLLTRDGAWNLTPFPVELV